MLRRHLGRSGAGRLALFALVPVVLGAGLWLVNRDGGSPATTRLEATQSSIDPLLGGQATVGPWDTAGPATAGQPAPATAGVGEPGAAESATAGAGPAETAAPAPAPSAAGGAVIGRADSIDGGVDGGAGSTSEPEPTLSRGTGAATSTADLSGGATSDASAPSATTSEPTTTSTPTTQATTTTTAAPAPAPSAGLSRNSAAAAEVVPLTNQDRSAAGLGTLSRNSCLDSAASGFAEQMARSGVLAHNPGAGAAVLGCRPGGAWGDNVGTSKPCDTALLEEEWMDSPSHRRNILTREFTLIGVGAWTDEKGACWVQVLFSS